MNINSAWKSTCKVLLGEEIGDLEEYRGYLLKNIEPVRKVRSAISGKEVAVSSAEKFRPDAKFISNDEAQAYGKWLAKSAALGINEIKDLDSILEALGEKLYYCGNVVLGNSSNASEATDCIDSHYVHSSWMVKSSKYVAFSSKARGSEYVFGCCDGGTSSFNIKTYGFYQNTRCMEALRSKPIADCYYVANLQGCKNCMFSFNLRNESYRIGNLKIGKEEYLKLKEKLLGDIRETLKRKKTLKTIVEIIAAGKAESAGIGSKGVCAQRKQSAPAPSIASIEGAFQKTCEILFGKRLPAMKECEGWLEEYSAGILKMRSCISGQEVCAPNLQYYGLIKGRLATLDESLELGKNALDKADVERLGLENAASVLAPISSTTSEVIMGAVFNMVDSVDYQDSSNAYKSSFVFFSKGIGCTFFTRECENVFGCYTMFFSNHCVRCRNSTNLARCFEASNSTNCTDSYFIYNCENVRDSMFCFNAKNLKNAIGNVQLAPEEYARIKKLVLGEIARRIEKNRRLDVGIYNIGAKE